MHRTTLLLLALFLVPACTEGNAATSNTQAPAQAAPRKSRLVDHDPALAKKLVAEGAVLLDVRTTDEFGDKHIPGAVNIPVDELPSRMSEMEKLTGGNKQKPIVVYCHSGSRSRVAKGMLVRAGYEMVTNLGRIEDWPRN